MGWTAHHLPPLQGLTRMDPLLRQMSTDDATVRAGIAMATRALSDARSDGDAAIESSMLGYLADAHRILGELAKAERYAREAVGMADRMSRPRRVSAWIRLGEILRCQDRFGEAIEAHQWALEMIDGASERYRGFALQHLGKVYLNMGAFAFAEEILTEALDIHRRDGSPEHLASTEEALAQARAGKGAKPDRR